MGDTQEEYEKLWTAFETFPPDQKILSQYCGRPLQVAMWSDEFPFRRSTADAYPLVMEKEPSPAAYDGSPVYALSRVDTACSGCEGGSMARF